MKVKEEIKAGNESWVKQYWRPAMAWQYFLVCLFDFILAPSILMATSAFTEDPYVQWMPLTLQLSGFYHVSMGAIIGVSAWTRGQEKIKRIEQGAPEESLLQEEGKVEQ